MWTVIKFDKKNLALLKKDFSIKLGKDVEFYSPKIQSQEPLSTEIQAFVDWIQLDKRPISDSKNGLEIVKVLQRAQESLVS